jgi:hypothetical protein
MRSLYYFGLSLLALLALTSLLYLVAWWLGNPLPPPKTGTVVSVLFSVGVGFIVGAESRRW